MGIAQGSILCEVGQKELAMSLGHADRRLVSLCQHLYWLLDLLVAPIAVR